MKARPCSVYLTGCNMDTGAIPAELGALGELAHLDLSTNELYGELR